MPPEEVSEESSDLDDQEAFRDRAVNADQDVVFPSGHDNFDSSDDESAENQSAIS